MSNRFVYGKDEKLYISKHQCDLCTHKTDENYGCDKFKQAPQEVIENKVKCKEFSQKGITYPWDK